MSNPNDIAHTSISPKGTGKTLYQRSIKIACSDVGVAVAQPHVHIGLPIMMPRVGGGKSFH